MLTRLSARNFTALPHLETSTLMKTLGGELRLATDKPNVIVGGNGVGKSTVLDTIAIRHAAYFHPASTFCPLMFTQASTERWWQEHKYGWDHDYDFAFLPGLECDSDNAPVLLYRADMMPLRMSGITARGLFYMDEAAEHDALTKGRSDGQKNLAKLQRALAVLDGSETLNYSYSRWGYGTEVRPRAELSRTPGRRQYEHMAEVLKTLLRPTERARRLVMLDEPERSVDARTMLGVWKRIEATDCSNVQVVIATHDVYPMLHPERFNLIEAEPDYVASVRALLN